MPATHLTDSTLPPPHYTTTSSLANRYILYHQSFMHATNTKYSSTNPSCHQSCRPVPSQTNMTLHDTTPATCLTPYATATVPSGVSPASSKNANISITDSKLSPHPACHPARQSVTLSSYLQCSLSAIIL
ncbi:hypothetical protein Pmani_022661 [Petrolisthes manimaculis]|uniref:Uncharacterized protein n=1 Tax=Petrolisthes manimaculis TaxID=1843537 RepID=A0AAE1PCC3_9EUCA|nr:hypothetical protein Pmani_022661 [Petrolisthes manimaculis]